MEILRKLYFAKTLLERSYFPLCFATNIQLYNQLIMKVSTRMMEANTKGVVPAKQIETDADKAISSSLRAMTMTGGTLG